MDMPCSTALGLLYGDVLGLVIALGLAPVHEAHPETAEVLIQSLGVGHVLGIGQRYPTGLFCLCHIGIDEGSNMGQSSADALCAICSCFSVLILEYFTRAQVHEMVLVQLLDGRAIGFLCEGCDLGDVAHGHDFGICVLVKLRSSLKLSDCRIAHLQFSVNVSS